ncbi:MAG: hypothetical protein ABI091_24915 [Ferruginibacter sp.]
MKRNISIKIKAAFLIVVFAMNTVVGFACAVGIDMGFNGGHHDDDDKAMEMAIHVHADGVKHNHHNETGKHHHDNKDHSKKDDCCNNKVVKISQTDKAVPQSGTMLHPAFVTAFISSFYSTDVLYAAMQIPNIKYYLQNYHPPIPDIGIAVQRFQI